MDSSQAFGEPLYDIRVCREDPNLFIILPAGADPREVIPHHSLIVIRETELTAGKLVMERVAERLGIDPEKLRGELVKSNFYIYRRSKRQSID